jgi:hypothetical protein
MSFARIPRQNLINYGVLPLIFAAPYTRLENDDMLVARNLRRVLVSGPRLSTRYGQPAKCSERAGFSGLHPYHCSINRRSKSSSGNHLSWLARRVRRGRLA